MGEARCFVGVQGSTNESDCEYSINGNKVTFTAKRALGPGENLSFVLKFKPGSFVVPEIKYNYWPFAISMMLLAIVLIYLVGGAIKNRVRVSRMKQQNKIIIVPQYSPPEDVAVVMAAEFCPTGARNAFAAQLIDLAVKGKLRLVESSETKKVFLSSYTTKNYSIEILNVNDLLPYETEFLKTLTSDISVGKVIDLESSGYAAENEKRAQRWHKFVEHVEEELKTNGFIDKKGSFKAGRTFLIFFAVFGLSMLNATLSSAFMDGVVYNIIVVASSPFIIFGCMFVGIMVTTISNRIEDKLLGPGWQLYAYLKGLDEYIKLAEADRIRFLQGPDTADRINIDDKQAMVKLYEKLLPYAIILGREKEWGKVLDNYYAVGYAPTWYSGTAAFSAASFSSSLGNFTSSMSMSTGSMSSGGSGFSGGGGGGSGGGGGGGGGGGR
jgi:uncharacterized membrane protein YgcG